VVQTALLIYGQVVLGVIAPGPSLLSGWNGTCSCKYHKYSYFLQVHVNFSLQCLLVFVHQIFCHQPLPISYPPTPWVGQQPCVEEDHTPRHWTATLLPSLSLL